MEERGEADGGEEAKRQEGLGPSLSLLRTQDVSSSWHLSHRPLGNTSAITQPALFT